MASSIEEQVFPWTLTDSEISDIMGNNDAAEDFSVDPENPPWSPNSTGSSSPTDSSSPKSPVSPNSSPPSPYFTPGCMNLDDFDDVSYAVCGLWQQDGSRDLNGFCWDRDCDHSPPAYFKSIYPELEDNHPKPFSPPYAADDDKDLESEPISQTCGFYKGDAVGFCWDETCDHQPRSHQDDASVPSEEQLPVCEIMGRHGKASNCDDTCDHSPGAPGHYVSDDDDEEEEEEEGIWMSGRELHVAHMFKCIYGIRKVKKERFKGRGAIMKKELIKKRRVETWGLPNWKQHGVIQHSLLGLE